MPDGTRGYAVGYGKPPVHTRFAKGRSGNPGGRPRGKNLTTLLQEALAETVRIELGGRRRRLSKGEAIIARLVDGSVAADPRSQRLLFQLTMKLETGSRQVRGDDEDEITDEEGEEARDYLMQELDRLAAEIVDEEDDQNAQALGRLAVEEAAARARGAAARQVKPERAA